MALQHGSFKFTFLDYRHLRRIFIEEALSIVEPLVVVRRQDIRSRIPVSIGGIYQQAKQKQSNSSVLHRSFKKKSEMRNGRIVQNMEASSCL